MKVKGFFIQSPSCCFHFFQCKIKQGAVVRLKLDRSVFFQILIVSCQKQSGLQASFRVTVLRPRIGKIQVNAIAFGMIDTEMNAEFDEEDLALIKEEIPADYIASPKEAAQMVYLVATSPAYMTGQVITFSGGWY